MQMADCVGRGMLEIERPCITKGRPNKFMGVVKKIQKSNVETFDLL